MRRWRRLIPEPFALHDVRDVEMHARALLDATLDGWGAKLDPEKHDDALTYLLERAWELSGIAGEREARVLPQPCGCCGERLRYVWWVEWATDEGELEDGELERTWYLTEHDAEQKASALVDAGAIVTVDVGPPAGAWDRSHGLAFATYSRRILSARVVDWYRSTFGDSRYENSRKREVSLDHLLSQAVAAGAYGNGWDSELGERRAHRNEREASADPLGARASSFVLAYDSEPELDDTLTTIAIAAAHLSPEARATLETIILPIAQRDATIAELASELGLERREVMRRREAFRNEFVQAAAF